MMNKIFVLSEEDTKSLLEMEEVIEMYTTHKLYHLVAQVRATSSVVESHPIAA